MKYTVEIAENETGIKVLPNDRIIAVLHLTPTELAYIPLHVYRVMMDLCNGEFSPMGKEAMRTLLDVFCDLLPDEFQTLDGLRRA